MQPKSGSRHTHTCQATRANIWREVKVPTYHTPGLTIAGKLGSAEVRVHTTVGSRKGIWMAVGPPVSMLGLYGKLPSHY